MFSISLLCSKFNGTSFITSHKKTAHNLKLEKSDKNLLAATGQAARAKNMLELHHVMILGIRGVTTDP